MRLFSVMHRNPYRNPAGIEHYYLDLIGGPIGRENQCYLLCPEGSSLCVYNHDSHFLSEQDYPANPADRGERIRDLKTERAFSQAIKDYHPDVVHFQVLRKLPLGLVEVAQQAGLPTVLTLHDYFLWCVHFTLLTPDFCHFETRAEACTACLRRHEFPVDDDFVGARRNYVGHLLAGCDRLVFPSAFVRNAFQSYYRHLDPERCTVIELGLHTHGNKLQPEPPREGVLRVAFLGNFLPHKGSHAFRGIVDELRDRRDMEFHILGHMYEPLDVDASNVRIHGKYDRRDVLEQLRRLGIDVIMLLSTTAETFSYTLSESILSGAVIIASDIGALRDRVAEAQVGFLVAHDDPVPRSCEILCSLAASPELVTSCKFRTAAAAGSVPTYEQMTEAHRRLYGTLVK